MKRLLRVTLLVLAAAGVASAQDDSTASSPATNVAAGFGNISSAASPTSKAILWRSADLRLANATSLAEPRSLTAPAEAAPAAPDPKFAYGSRDDFRWQLALGISVLRFRSSIYYTTGVGTNTAVTYFTNEWFGVEGSIITAFAPAINLNEHVKYVSYGAGPKIAWRARKWEPWAHTIVGGVHIQPQTANNNSRNGFGLQVGGGADYRIFPHLSARVGVDWVRTHLFGEWQNSAQVNADVVVHF
jgi:opacity protein-like surface antigen